MAPTVAHCLPLSATRGGAIRFGAAGRSAGVAPVNANRMAIDSTKNEWVGPGGPAITP